MSTMQTAAEAGSAGRLQRLIDEAAGFNVMAVPEARPSGSALRAAGRNGVIGWQVREALHRFDIVLDPPSAGGGIKAANSIGETAGWLDLRWLVIPRDFLARPDREPPATLLDPERSQRFTMQEATFRFGDGSDGFRSFGTGRTFPAWYGGRPRLVAAAVGNVTEGFGKFRGHEGNYTLCGEIDPERGFIGHGVVRILDSEGNLRTAADLPPVPARENPDPDATYLLFGAQKGPGQENRFSFGADGQIRGANILTQLKLLRLGFAAGGSEGFRANDLRIGEPIGLEEGFGRGAELGAGQEGSALKPFLFEGVAKYTFHDASGREIGAVVTNVLEGRRFDVRLPAAPDEP
ncbi:MAG TPA: hypothetical protein VF414_22220, partial [Thermoanaerobaculia bacterium]